MPSPLRSRELGTVILLLVVFVGTAIREPRFLQPESLNGILLWIPLLAIVGVGQMLVIVTRGIDVSVGSIVGVAGMVVGTMFREHHDLSVPVAFAIGSGVGLVLGAINAAVIAWGRVPPIVATLGTLSAYRGLAFLVGGGRQVDSNDLPDALTGLSQAGPIRLGGLTVPWILLLALLVAGLTSAFVHRTRAGRDVFALGSHPEAARLRGVPVASTTFLVYALSGALAGLAGVLYASRYGFVNPATAGSGMELVVIAAVVIGGTRVTGGSGTVAGVLLGCLLLGAISVALAVLGIAGTWQSLVYGAVILLALLFDVAFRRTLDRFGVVA